MTSPVSTALAPMRDATFRATSSVSGSAGVASHQSQRRRDFRALGDSQYRRLRQVYPESLGDRRA